MSSLKPLRCRDQLLDTADVYSEGQSGEDLWPILKNLGIARKDVVIATKVFGRTGPGQNDRRSLPRPHHGRRRCQPSPPPNRLIDLYQIHGNDVITPIEETLRAWIHL